MILIKAQKIGSQIGLRVKGKEQMTEYFANVACKVGENF